MDMSRSVDATANVAQQMIEAQRRSYEAMTDAVVEGQKRGVRFAHGSFESFSDRFGSGSVDNRSGSQWADAYYDPYRLALQSLDLFHKQMSTSSDYFEEQAGANQRLYNELENSARAQRENFRKLTDEWLGLFRESTAGARSQAEEGVKTFQQAADQGLHAVANGHDSANGHSAAGFPISGFEDLSVNDVFQQLRELSKDDLQKVRAYETENKNRSSLVNELDRRIKSAS